MVNTSKYRAVIRGNLLMHRRDYHETFAPVVRVSTLRMLFALAAQHNWEIKQGDVPTAFLKSNMDT